MSEASSYGMLMASVALWGRNWTHLYRSKPGDNPHDLNGRFWDRHRELDNTITDINLSLPRRSRLHLEETNPDVIVMHMFLYSSTIFTHQVAAMQAEKHSLSNETIEDSQRRCLIAANGIASVMRAVTHIDFVFVRETRKSA